VGSTSQINPQFISIKRAETERPKEVQRDSSHVERVERHEECDASPDKLRLESLLHEKEDMSDGVQRK
jgi:hypothetical protein